jgi:hypothetical protein
MLVSSNELIYAPYWHHQIRSDGTMSEVELADGKRLISSKIDVVFNRLSNISITHFVQEGDCYYATMEMYALLLSWLHSFPCKVINPAVPRGLGAHRYSQIVWLMRAAQAGLPVRNLHFTTNPRNFPKPNYTPYPPFDMSGGTALIEPLAVPFSGNRPIYFMEPVSQNRQRVLIVGEEIIGGLGIKYTDALRQLARNAGCDLLQVDFGRFDTQWKVIAVDAFPQLTNEAEYQALLTLLERHY